MGLPWHNQDIVGCLTQIPLEIVSFLAADPLTF
jgi:hypothetical protein